MKKRKFIVFLASLFITCIFTLSACENIESTSIEQPQTCQHQWVEADCLYPKTCRLCNETEGTALGHDFTDATCTEPQTCSECGMTLGNTLEHNFVEATCTTPKTCSECGFIEGIAFGHSWDSATCQTPKTCNVCGATEGNPLSEHNYQNGKCTFCNQSDPKEVEYESAYNAYNYLVDSHELCIDIMDSIYGAWYFAIFKSDNYYMFSSCLKSFCSEANLNQQETTSAIDKVLKKAGIDDIDDDWRCVAMQLPSYAVAIVIQVYINNGDYSKIDNNLSKAKISLNSVTNKYSDYTGYSILKSYYSEISAYAEFCKAPTGSFNQLKTTINTYETNLRNYKNNLSIIFD